MLLYDNLLFFPDDCKLEKISVDSFATEQLRSHPLLSQAHTLFIRSKTKVNLELLQSAPQLEYIGSATSGNDHFEIKQSSRSSRFFHAAGCNSNSVAEYVLAVILRWMNKGLIQPADGNIAVIGIGHIGSKVARYVQALGFTPLLFDPFLTLKQVEERVNPPFHFISQPEELNQATLFTLHTPLTKHLHWPTYHFIPNVIQPKPDSLILNASRGEVISRDWLESVPLKALWLDVFPNEPHFPDFAFSVSHDLIITPHIAGYSLDGRVNGSFMVYQDWVNWTLQQKKPFANDLLPIDNKKLNTMILQTIDQVHPVSEKKQTITVNLSASQTIWQCAEQIIRQIIPIDQDNADFRVSQNFSYLRAHYPIRREFKHWQIVLQTNDSLVNIKLLKKMLTDFGFLFVKTST